MKKILFIFFITTFIAFFGENTIYNTYLQDQEYLESIVNAKKLLDTMTIEEKIGQVLLARVPEENQTEMISNYHLGGYILFGRDVTNITKEDLIHKITSWEAASSIPLIFAIDEEGGKVTRLSSNPNIVSTPFLSSQELYKQGGFERIYQDTILKNHLLEQLHINLNLAPVADISLNPSSYIYQRTFGKDANKTSEYISTVIKACQNTNVSCTLKHFPGYGENVDTHKGLAYDDRTIEELQANDFLPFLSGIKEGVSFILVNHTIYSNIEKDVPATLSSKIHQILRKDLNFHGLIITDDLEMDAIKKNIFNPYIKALNAGNDILIVSNIEEAYNELYRGIQENKIKEETLNQAVLRILTWKYSKLF